MRLERLTIKAQEALEEARKLADKHGHPEIRATHLLVALASQGDGIVPPVLQRLGTDPRAIVAAAQELLTSAPSVKGDADLRVSQSLGRILESAEALAKELQDEYLSTEHMLLAIARSRDEATEILNRLGATEQGLLAALREVRGSGRVTDQNPEEKFQALKRFAKDLTELARQGKLDPVIGRDEEIRRVMQVLSRRTKNNPVLIGDPGVGKTAIAEGLARRIADGDAPATLQDRSVVALDLG
ncbi:MAG: type VI secretion system ATPase TssH, partial [bacterium]|nr:type VI secretion system ATPase TssH [bacterium]